MGHLMVRLFLLPGETVCNAVHVDDDEDRTMIRSLVNMLFWNLLGVLAVVVLW